MGGNTTGKVVGETGKGESAQAANPALKVETPKEKSWWGKWADAIHEGLDLAGNIPVVGIVADAANAGIYAAEGNYVQAAISGVSAAANFIPGGGIVAHGGKTLGKAALKLGEKEAAKVVEKEAAEAAAKKLAKEKAEKEAAEKLAKEKAEKEAAEKAGKKQTDTKIKPKTMPQKKVKCFKAGKKTKGKAKEYDRQLADQEKGLNDMTVKEYLEGRAKYAEIGREGTGAAQQSARDKYAAELQEGFKEQLKEQGVRGAAAAEQAAKSTKDKMDTLAALHNPDMIAGGKDVVTGMGDRGVNSSIGGQWNKEGRLQDLDAHAQKIPEAARATTKMNVKLERCP
jgi:Novel toxin 15